MSYGPQLDVDVPQRVQLPGESGVSSSPCRSYDVIMRPPTRSVCAQTGFGKYGTGHQYDTQDNMGTYVRTHPPVHLACASRASTHERGRVSWASSLTGKREGAGADGMLADEAATRAGDVEVHVRRDIGIATACLERRELPPRMGRQREHTVHAPAARRSPAQCLRSSPCATEGDAGNLAASGATGTLIDVGCQLAWEIPPVAVRFSS
ncbi:hypothetical protein FB451DRAFT_1185258 [Mycena latifolia]|nr:hypothetical protein FB451DRAFT_1185258 [Mycena latifolia]